MSTVWVLTDERYLAQRMPRVLIDELRARGLATRTLVAERLVQRLGDLHGEDPWAGLRPGDVVLARTRNRFALALLRGASRRGVRVLTPADPIAVVRDKPRTAQLLAEHGVPTPVTYLADSPAGLRGLPADRFPLLLKPHAGDNARGIVLVRGTDELDDVEWTDSMVLAQEYVDSGAVDLKVYAVGDTVWGVRRPSPLALHAGARSSGAQRVDVGPQLRHVAGTIAAAFSLELFGIDVLETDRGPLVVDVNEFPNYTGIDEAPAAAAELVAAAVGAVAA
jgi:ribosomal protein S6--L-glutamate ligase